MLDFRKILRPSLRFLMGLEVLQQPAHFANQLSFLSAAHKGCHQLFLVSCVRSSLVEEFLYSTVDVKM